MKEKLLSKCNELLKMINDVENIVKNDSVFVDFILNFKKGIILFKDRIGAEFDYRLEADRIRGARRWLGEYTSLPSYRELFDMLSEIEDLIEEKCKK